MWPDWKVASADSVHFPAESSAAEYQFHIED